MRVRDGVQYIPLPVCMCECEWIKRIRIHTYKHKIQWLHSMLDVNDPTKTIFQGSLWVCNAFFNECQRTFSIAFARITSNSSVFFFLSLQFEFFSNVFFLFLLIYNSWLFCFVFGILLQPDTWNEQSQLNVDGFQLEATLPPPLLPILNRRSAINKLKHFNKFYWKFPIEMVKT